MQVGMDGKVAGAGAAIGVSAIGGFTAEGKEFVGVEGSAGTLLDAPPA
jgi:hypothetical protein